MIDLFWLCIILSGIVQTVGVVLGYIYMGTDIKFLLPFFIYAMVNIITGYIGIK